jgi:hypothetical protein
MVYLGGVASNAQDLISLLQARSANPGAAIPVIGADSFPDPISGNASGSTGASASTGSASPLLNSNVLGYLILTQSQNTGTTTTGSSPAQPHDFRQAFSQMATAIQSGDLSGAQQAYAALGQFQPSNQGGSAPSGPFAQGLSAIGQDLQNGNLSAAQQDLASLELQMQSAGGAHHHHHHHHHADASASQGAGGTSGSDNGGLDQALTNLLQTDGTSSNTTNPDGSTTTTITYADGSKVTMTTAAPSAAAATATPGTAAQVTPTTNTSNVLEMLIQLQAQLTAPASRSAA